MFVLSHSKQTAKDGFFFFYHLIFVIFARKWNWELCPCHVGFKVEVKSPNEYVWEISRHIRLDTQRKQSVEWKLDIILKQCDFIKNSESVKQWESYIESNTIARTVKILMRITKEVSEERNEACSEKWVFPFANELGYAKRLSLHIQEHQWMSCLFATPKGPR